jgi:lysozyme
MTVNNLTISDDGLSMLKAFENCELTAYPDQEGVMTVGWGHTGSDVYDGLTITQDQADQLLANDLRIFENWVNKLVTVELNQSQFDALTDFTFNEGEGHLQMSTMLKQINANDFTDAALQFIRWDIAGGKVDDGLLRRRQAEREMFVGGDWTIYNNGQV